MKSKSLFAALVAVSAFLTASTSSAQETFRALAFECDSAKAQLDIFIPIANLGGNGKVLKLDLVHRDEQGAAIYTAQAKRISPKFDPNKGMLPGGIQVEKILTKVLESQAGFVLSTDEKPFEIEYINQKFECKKTQVTP